MRLLIEEEMFSGWVKRQASPRILVANINDDRAAEENRKMQRVAEDILRDKLVIEPGAFVCHQTVGEEQ